jgi:hypothetical protein
MSVTNKEKKLHHPKNPKKGDRFKLVETGEIFECIEDSEHVGSYGVTMTRSKSITNMNRKDSIRFCFGQGMWQYLGNFLNNGE